MLPTGVVRDMGVLGLRGEVRLCLGVVRGEIQGSCSGSACAFRNGVLGLPTNREEEYEGDRVWVVSASVALVFGSGQRDIKGEPIISFPLNFLLRKWWAGIF